ncbi:MAG: hypothetical protein PHG25_03930 [Candidatus Pacebacteria bacterium]|nr:hypothetical protein [Candidatus Paceibacterota bacterium]
MDKKIYVTGIIFLTLCFVSYFLNDYVSGILHALVNIIAPGRSDSKPIFFFSYGITIGFIYLFYYAKKDSVLVSKIKKYIPVSLWLSVSASFALSLGVYVWFMIKYHLPFTYTLIAHNDTFTSTALLHNHFTKGALVFVTQFFASSGIANVDSGTALIGLVPQWIFFAQALVVLIAVISFVLYYRIVLGYIRSLTLTRNISFSLLYGLSSFMVLKSMLDGGIFDAVAIPSIVFFVVLTVVHKKRVMWIVSTLSAVHIILMSWLYCTGYFSGDQDYVYHMYTILVDGAVLGVLYITFALQHNRLYFLTALFLLIFMYPQVKGYVVSTDYIDQPVSTDGAWVSSYKMLTDSRFTSVGEVGRVNVYSFVPSASDDIRVSDLVDMSGFISSYTPVTVIYDQCFPHTSFISSNMKVHSPVAVSSHLSTTTRLYGLSMTPYQDPGGTSQGMFEYNHTVSFAPCLPMQLASFVEVVRSLGLSTFFISDIQANTNDPLNLVTF